MAAFFKRHGVKRRESWKVRYTLRAQADLGTIYTYLDERAPVAAGSVKQLIERRILPASQTFHSQPQRPISRMRAN